jgi:hypothetical protein
MQLSDADKTLFFAVGFIFFMSAVVVGALSVIRGYTKRSQNKKAPKSCRRFRASPTQFTL